MFLLVLGHPGCPESRKMVVVVVVVCMHTIHTIAASETWSKGSKTISNKSIQFLLQGAELNHLSV